MLFLVLELLIGIELFKKVLVAFYRFLSWSGAVHTLNQFAAEKETGNQKESCFKKERKGNPVERWDSKTAFYYLPCKKKVLCAHQDKHCLKTKPGPGPWTWEKWYPEKRTVGKTGSQKLKTLLFVSSTWKWFMCWSDSFSYKKEVCQPPPQNNFNEIAFAVLKILHNLVSMQNSLLANNYWSTRNATFTFI